MGSFRIVPEPFLDDHHAPSFETDTVPLIKDSWFSKLSIKGGKPRNAQESATNSTAVSPSMFQKIVAELMGTYIFVFVGGASALAHRDSPLPIEATAVVWGLVYMGLKYALAHVSGAFMNPASSVAFAVVKKLPWKNVPVYILAQIVGSVLASLNLRGLFHQQPDIRPVVTQVISPTTPLQAVAWEYTITFFLNIISSGVATDSRAHKMLFGVALGATVAFNVIIAGDITGAAMNPARSIGPAIVAGEYKDLWVYVVGPFLGATSATLAYGFLRLPEPKKLAKESKPKKSSKKRSKIYMNELYTEPSYDTTQLENFRHIFNVV